MTQDMPSSSGLRRRATHTPPQATEQKTIDPATFYGPGSSKALGSSHTAYIPPETFREPELVDERTSNDEVPPWEPKPTWGEYNTENDPWGTIDSNLNSWGEPNTTSRKIAIDGRDENEEIHWYDVALRAKCARPGPGVLPPLLADMLHDPDHALYSVSPEVHPPLVTPTSPHTPTADEVRTAIPHPNAYYCREHNGWVFLLWRSSSVLPPLVKDPENPLPSQTRRKVTNSCVGDAEQPFGQANLTHHWHRYEKTVDASKLNPPYTHGELLLDLYLCCQCSTYCLVSDIIPGVIPLDIVNKFTEEKIAHPALDKTPRATALAGWETVLTIIDNRLWRDEKRSLPVGRNRFKAKLGWNGTVELVFAELGFPLADFTQAPGKPPEPALQPPPIDSDTPEGQASRKKLLRAWVELSAWLAIYGKNREPLKDYNPVVIHVKADSVRDLYQTGIGAHVSQLSRDGLPDQLVGYAPLEASWKTLGMTPSSYTWERLAFAYLAQCRCDPANTPIYFAHLNSIVNTMLTLRVDAPTELQTLIMEERERFRSTPEDYVDAAQKLGFGRDGEVGVELDSDVDDEFVARAWRSARQRAWQLTADEGSKRRATLNDALKIIGEQRGSQALLKVWADEKGTGMSPETAYGTLDVPKDVEEGILLTVFSMRIEDQPSQLEKMREALSVIAEVTNSERVRQYLTTGTDPGDSTVANTSPEMPRGLNQLGNTCYLNSLLQYFYTIKELRAAIASLSNAGTKSDDSKFTDDDLKRHRVGGRLVTRREILRSKKFASLLADLFWNMEYCETTAVTPAIELAKLALVTSQDEEEDETDKAGTDSSNDTDATLVDDLAPSRSTFDRSSSSPTQLQSPKSPTDSVLGKRSRDADPESAMDVDTPAHSPPHPSADIGSPTSAEFLQTEAWSSSSSSSAQKQPATGKEADVEMKNESRAGSKAPPPLPPRKARQTDDSVMMFGRQHDVSECMDNCMFQIETALLDFHGMATSDDDKTSPVKRLFYGKKRQRLIAVSSDDDARHQSSIHEKEDLFSHLHVNVADENFDLYDGLARYFDDTVEDTKKRMEVTLVDLPPLLQIQLQRVQFNRETQQAYKSQAYVKFGETIHMDRFLDSANPQKKAQSKIIHAELTASRERIQRLTQGKHAPFAPALAHIADFLSQQTTLELPADESLVSSLRTEEAFITEQLRVEREKTSRLKQQLEDIWKDETSAAYELTSVFIHRGSSPSWGHYFFYSRNLPDHPDQWFKYNDSDVSQVSKDEVLADTTGSTANPYMLVFVRKDCDAIDTVHRFNPELIEDDT